MTMTDVKEKIAKEVYEGYTGLPWPPDEWPNEREAAYKHADAILSLLGETGFVAVSECPEKDFHPVNGMCITDANHNCPMEEGCNDGTITRPLTPEEFKTKALEWFEALKTYCEVFCRLIKCSEGCEVEKALTLDGARIRKREESTGWKIRNVPLGVVDKPWKY
jgi:hypothetical protein